MGAAGTTFETGSVSVAACRRVEQACDESVHPVLDFGQVVGRGAAPRLDLGESHREASVGTRQARGRDGLSLRERLLLTPQLCIRLIARRLTLRSRALLSACRRRVHRSHGPEQTQSYTDNAQEYPLHRASSAASSRRQIPPGRLASNGMWYVVLPGLVLTVAATELQPLSAPC